MEALILPNTKSLLEVSYLLTPKGHFIKTHAEFITASGMSEHSNVKYEDILINEKPHIKQRSQRLTLVFQLPTVCNTLTCLIG